MLILIGVIVVLVAPVVAAWLSRTGDVWFAILAVVAGGAAAHAAAWAAQTNELPEWAIITLMLGGTVVGAGHPFRYLEYSMDWINATCADRFGDGLGSAVSGLVGGIFAVLIGCAIGAGFKAVAVLREAGGFVSLLVAVLSGYGLCGLVTLVPAEAEHRRVHAFLALCSSPVAVGLLSFFRLHTE